MRLPVGLGSCRDAHWDANQSEISDAAVSRELRSHNLEALDCSGLFHVRQSAEDQCQRDDDGGTGPKVEVIPKSIERWWFVTSVCRRVGLHGTVRPVKQHGQSVRIQVLMNLI